MMDELLSAGWLIVGVLIAVVVVLVIVTRRVRSRSPQHNQYPVDSKPDPARELEEFYWDLVQEPYGDARTSRPVAVTEVSAAVTGVGRARLRSEQPLSSFEMDRSTGVMSLIGNAWHTFFVGMRVAGTERERMRREDERERIRLGIERERMRLQYDLESRRLGRATRVIPGELLDATAAPPLALTAPSPGDSLSSRLILNSAD
jgi:hypothetical protein